MKSADESSAILGRALAAAAGDEADAVLTSTDRNITRFANSTIHQNMSEISSDLTLRIVQGGRIGVASTSLLDDIGISQLAATALDAARRSEPVDGFRGLLATADSVADLEAFDEETAAIAPLTKAEDLLALFEKGRKVETHFAGSYSTSSGSVATASSHGIRRYAPLTSAEGLVIAIGSAGSGFSTRIARSAARAGIAELGDEALEKAFLSADVRGEIEPGTWDVILAPAAIAEIFEWMSMITFSGQSYEDGSSFFVDHLGQKVLGANFTLADDALDPDFLPFPFDMEGAAKRRVALVDKGVAVTPVVDKLFSDRLGIAPTASAAGLSSDDHGMPLHLSLQAGVQSVEDMIGNTERGIWITRFHYLNGLLEPRRALMTGMTRDGTFLVENGRVTKRLPNLRWTQSMVEAFSNIEATGRERRAVGTWWNPVGGTLAPHLKIRNWNFTGVQRQ